MHFLSLLWHGVWIARIGLQAILLAIMVRRKIYRKFPAFLLYIAWAVVSGSTLVIMLYGGFATGREYYQAYRIDIAGGAVLSFCVLYELFERTLRDYPVLSDVGNSLYRWVALVFMGIAVFLAWSVPAMGSGKLLASFFVLQRSARLLQCGLLIFLFVFVRSFHLSWRNRAFGIALGFGISATVSLALAAIRAQIEPVFSNPAKEALRLTGQVGDLCAVGVWIWYLLLRESAAGQVPPPTLPDDDLGPWNRELRRLIP